MRKLMYKRFSFVGYLYVFLCISKYPMEEKQMDKNFNIVESLLAENVLNEAKRTVGTVIVIGLLSIIMGLCHLPSMVGVVMSVILLLPVLALYITQSKLNYNANSSDTLNNSVKRFNKSQDNARYWCNK